MYNRRYPFPVVLLPEWPLPIEIFKLEHPTLALISSPHPYPSSSSSYDFEPKISDSVEFSAANSSPHKLMVSLPLYYYSIINFFYFFKPVSSANTYVVWAGRSSSLDFSSLRLIVALFSTLLCNYLAALLVQPFQLMFRRTDRHALQYCRSGNKRPLRIQNHEFWEVSGDSIGTHNKRD